MSRSTTQGEGWFAAARSPLALAAWLTWLGVAAGSLDSGRLAAGEPAEWAGLVVMLVFAVLFATVMREGCSDRRARIATVLQAGCAVLAVWLLREGTVAVLSIIVAAQASVTLPRWVTIALIGVVDLSLAWIWAPALGWGTKLLVTMLPMIGFQAFAALTLHYAHASEAASAELGEVNAELLATRKLLEESARSAERLKLSRELHDVAGHKLTALKLNLARLARDPELAGREEVNTSAGLADELLADIRAVVGELRRHDGIDLGEALDALVRPIPGTRFRIDLDEGTRVDEVHTAEALLRCAQEGITNALRHGRAREIVLACRRQGDRVILSVTDDGIERPRLRFGNGLNGMRERLEELGGALEVVAAEGRGVRLTASLPVAA